MTDAQFKKGVLEMCVLYTVAERDMYGYEIMKRVKAFFPDVYDSTIYAGLRRLAAGGCLESYSGETSEGPTRKYYKITAGGTEYLKGSLEQWRSLCAAVRDMGIT